MSVCTNVCDENIFSKDSATVVDTCVHKFDRPSPNFEGFNYIMWCNFKW